MRDQIMKQMKNIGDQPLCDPGQKWFNLPQAKMCVKTIRRFFSTVTAISGMSENQGIELSRTIGPWPHDATACCRLSWLKHYLECCEKFCVLLRNTIKKMEEQKP